MHKAIIAAAALLSLTSPAFAWGLGHHPDGWRYITVAGIHMWAPPAVCTVGSLKRYNGPFYLPQKVMDRILGGPAGNGHHNWGDTTINDYGITVYISRDIPPAAQAAALVHELALVRGCGDDPVDSKHDVGF